MTLEDLIIEYAKAFQTDEYDDHARFIKLLLSEKDRDVVEWHFDVLRNHENRDLYLRLRLALIKRGQSIVPFLLEKVAVESDIAMQADLLHILGRLRVPQALDLARKALGSDDDDMRHRGCYVIGWMGDSSDLPALGSILLHDRDDYVRRTAATAHSQMFDRLPDLKSEILRNLQLGLNDEASEEVAKWIIVTVQYVASRKFGLREDVEEAVVRGDVPAARKMCSEFLNKTLGI